MSGLAIVNTETGARVRRLRNRVAEWSEPDAEGRTLVRFNARPGMTFASERVVEVAESVSGEGPAMRVVSETWDGGDRWVISKERYTPAPAPVSEATMIARIRAEAERRIEAGVEIGGTRFRCDGRSLTRIQAFAALAQRLEAVAETVGITFMTEAGVTVALTSAAQAEAICDAATAHVGSILEKSNALQTAQAALTDEERATLDETDDDKWGESE